MELDHSEDLVLLREPARQSPVAVGEWILTRLRGIGAINVVIALGVILSGQVPGWVLGIAPLVAVVVIALGIASWWRLTFRATTEELIVTRGVFSRETMVIPFSKVQSVSIEEGLLQRLFGLVSASIDTAGSALVEFSIHGIQREQAEALRRLASQAHRSAVSRSDSPSDSPSMLGPPSVPAIDGLSPPTGLAPGVGQQVGQRTAALAETVVLAKRTPKELMLIGMLGNPFGGLALLGALFIFADDLIELVGDRLPDVDGSAIQPSTTIAVMVLAAAVTVFLLSWVAIGLRTVVVDWDLVLSSTDQGLSVHAGLLKRRSQSSHLNKVQSIEVTHGPLLRLVGFCRLRLRTIGSGDLVIPGVSAGELAAVRQQVSLPFDAEIDRGISRHLVFQRIRLALYLAVPAGVATAFLNFRVALLWLVLPLLVAFRAFLFHRSFRWDMADGIISRRSGNFFITEIAMSVGKTQKVEVSQSFYQRKRGLSSISISNAEASVHIPMLTLDESQALRDLLLADRSPIDFQAAIWRGATPVDQVGAVLGTPEPK